MKRFLICLVGLFLGLSLAQAGEPVRVRLYQDQDQAIVAISLAEGYKTYWRMPGEAGIAPSFAWKGSENLAQAQVEMPAPQRYDEAEGELIGYRGEVNFWVKLEPEAAGAPVKPKLQLFMGVCQELCLPVNVEVTPEPAPPGLVAKIRENLPQALAGVHARLERQGVLVQLPVKADDIFIEPEAVLAYFSKPEARGEGEYWLPISGDMTELSGKTLRLTVISGARSFVSSVIVD